MEILGVLIVVGAIIAYRLWDRKRYLEVDSGLRCPGCRRPLDLEYRLCPNPQSERCPRFANDVTAAQKQERKDYVRKLREAAS